MNCDLARTEMIAYLKGELSEESRARLEEHLARCPTCRHELEGARRLLSWTEAASEEAVIKAVEGTIDRALPATASDGQGSTCIPPSDIHWEPQRDNTLLVRYRIDGVLHEVARFDSAMRGGIVNRIKMMAEMDAAESRIPQDGRMPWRRNDTDYDIFVSCLPCIYGEGFVMRILDRSNIMIGLDRLGFYEDDIKTLLEIAHQPCGMLALTGPTGSGKTTTAYSLLMQLVSPELKVLTIEDPVEYQLPGTNQVQVYKKAGLTFPVAARAFLRHDPDIVYLGEIRDYETAEIAVQTAITGHLVITVLHTNDAISAITRWLDIGVEPYMVSATFTGVVAQRLARKICRDCKQEYAPDPNSPVLKALGITQSDLAGRKLYRGAGCDTCRKTGYRGRAGLYEILRIDRDLASLIAERAPKSELLACAQSHGFRLMREDAKRKVLDGLTTPEEALRVLATSS